jgi:hypothetical protein
MKRFKEWFASERIVASSGVCFYFILVNVRRNTGSGGLLLPINSKQVWLTMLGYVLLPVST